MISGGNRRRDFLICAGLVLVTLAVFWPVTRCDFVTYDDPSYVTKNPYVQNGFAWESVRWAFTCRYSDNWHPLTWLSHMLDCRLFGLKAAGHHLTNLLLHLANTALIFLVLKRMTGAVWRSAFVAALFALHPLHVESVAWVSERKDVLSTFFWALAVLAYARYAARPAGPRYLPVLVCFALGLMAKPMLVTLPFLLLLLDFWPLKRFPATVRVFRRTFTIADASEQEAGLAPVSPRVTLARLAAEKLPMIVLSAVSSVLTIWAQSRAVVSLAYMSFAERLCNAVYSYNHYLAKMIWPSKLVVFCPLPQVWVIWQVATAGLVVIGLSVAAVWQVRKRPYLATGWFWFLGTLMPVIGFVKQGLQSHADRYSYVPLIGLFIIIAWGACDLARRWRLRPVVLGSGAALALLACISTTRAQLAHWQNGITLFEHAIEFTTNNAMAHAGLGRALVERGRLQEASEQFARAIQIEPNYADARHEWANAIFLMGRIEESLEQRRAVVKLRPESPLACYNLAFVLLATGQHAEAATWYREAIRLQPNWPVPLNDLAWILATSSHAELRNGAEAVELAGRACKLTGGRDARFLGTLDAAYAEAGRFPEAISIAEQSRALALTTSQNNLAQDAEKRLEFYRAGKPFRQ